LVALMGRETYTATAVRDGGWWAIEVPALPGVFTQARRLDQAEAMVRDVVSLWLHVPGDSFDVGIEPMLGPVADLVREAIVARQASEQAERQASASMLMAATTLVDSGLTLRDTGTILNVSYQRIQQIVGGVRSVGSAR
jgi:predicted RNase H-like HicB family nuclease